MSTNKQPQPFTPLQVAIANPVMRWMSRVNTWLYRASGAGSGAAGSMVRRFCC